MKILNSYLIRMLSFCGFLLIGISLQAQEIGLSQAYFLTNFENDYSFIEFDPPVNNIWQVGKPSKTFLDSAYSAPYALITDSSNLISDSIKHSFILKFERPWYANCLWSWVLQFYSKYSFDSLNSSGYIEVSYNKGNSWYDVNEDSVFLNNRSSISSFYNLNDTLWNNKPGITGKNTFKEYPVSIGVDWEPTFEEAAKVKNIWVKFSYESNGKAEAHEGWMIDNLDFIIYYWCEYLDIFNTYKEAFYSKAYPNPATNYITIACETINNEQHTFQLFNSKGQLMQQFLVDDINAINLNLSEHTPGQYFYILLDTDNKVTHKGKFIKE